MLIKYCNIFFRRFGPACGLLKMIKPRYGRGQHNSYGGEVNNTHELWEAICEAISDISKWNTEIKAVYAQKFRQPVVDITF